MKFKKIIDLVKKHNTLCLFETAEMSDDTVRLQQSVFEGGEENE